MEVIKKKKNLQINMRGLGTTNNSNTNINTIKTSSQTYFNTRIDLNKHDKLQCTNKVINNTNTITNNNTNPISSKSDKQIKTSRNEIELNKSLIKVVSKENFNNSNSSFHNKRWSDIHSQKTTLSKTNKINTNHDDILTNKTKLETQRSKSKIGNNIKQQDNNRSPTLTSFNNKIILNQRDKSLQKKMSRSNSINNIPQNIINAASNFDGLKTFCSSDQELIPNENKLTSKDLKTPTSFQQQCQKTQNNLNECHSANTIEINQKIKQQDSSGNCTENSKSSRSKYSSKNIVNFKVGLFKHSDKKTDSTFVSGGDSSLDCEENISQSGRNCDALFTQELNKADEKLIQKIDSEQDETDHKINQLLLLNFDQDRILFLIERETYYMPNPFYLEKKQQQITWIMRSILIDWMMEVCMEFTLKRETFHLAVNFTDRYLSQAGHIQKWQLQLIGVAAMYIASKQEEIYSPKIADFARSADNGYTHEQIKEMEINIVYQLDWQLAPPTGNMWANYFMMTWDYYIENSPYAISHSLFTYICEEGVVAFKQPNEKSYIRFRELMQLIDISQLDIQTLQYQPRILVLAYLYLVLGISFGKFTNQMIVQHFSNGSIFLQNSEFQDYNDLFSDFLISIVNIQLTDILPHIQYAATFFGLVFNFDLPTAVKINKDIVLKGHLEEFLSYQTHNPMGLEFIKNRTRNMHY